MKLSILRLLEVEIEQAMFYPEASQRWLRGLTHTRVAAPTAALVAAVVSWGSRTPKGL